ncbi:MAG TPA: hypothetical protein PLY71_04345 [Candidatus Fermentibacter daniensis]|nr:hypothetical protein [Candidatus Fermentibacter daniensis]
MLGGRGTLFLSPVGEGRRTLPAAGICPIVSDSRADADAASDALALPLGAGSGNSPGTACLAMDLEVRRVAVLEPAAGVFAVEEGCGRGFALTVSSTGPISIGSACSSTGVTRGVLGSKVRRTTGSPASAEVLRGEGSGLERVASEDSA